MARKIDENRCIGCGACERTCIVGYISEKVNRKREINTSACVDCGACEMICPVKCISKV